MLGAALKTFAEASHLTVGSDAAFGYLQGCFVTLTEQNSLAHLSIYVGVKDPVSPNGGAIPQTSLRAQQIAEMILATYADQNVYQLAPAQQEGSPVTLQHEGTVVTVTFGNMPDAMSCVERFAVEMLPRIAPMTAPMQCHSCGQHTQGVARPIMLSADAVVPMHEPCFTANHPLPAAKSTNTALGIVGAAIGALLGAALWALVYQLGWIVGVIGFFAAVLAMWGYDLCKGKPGTTRFVTIAICSLCAVILGQIIGCFIPVWQEYEALGSVVHRMMSFTAYAKVIAKEMLSDRSFMLAFGTDLLIGVLFAGVSCIQLLRDLLKDKHKFPRQMNGHC